MTTSEALTRDLLADNLAGTRALTDTHVTVAPTVDDILGAAVGAKLDYLAQTSTTIDWAVSDATVALIAEKYPAYSKAAIRAAVADKMHCTPSAVRAHEAVSRYWDDADREEYGPLGYSHFRLAMSQPDPRADLQWCLESADGFGGKLASYTVYKAVVAARKNKPEPTFAELCARAAGAVTRARDACSNERHHDALAKMVEKLETMA